MRFDENSISEAIDGTKRLLCYLGMINEKYEERTSKLLLDSSWLRATRAGMFKSFVECGDPVMKNQPVGVINDPFGHYEVKIISKYEGYVIGMNNNPVVHQGDAVFHIGLETGK